MLSPGDIAPPLRHVLRRLPRVAVDLLEVDGFDLERRVVHAVRPPSGERVDLSYDTLIVAAGAGQSYFGHDEFALYAPGMKTIDDAMELRRRILGALELAETATTPEERREWLTIVVVGAGPTGVEIAGQIRELAVRSLQRRPFTSFDPASVRVVLVDGGKEPLATFGDQLSAAAARELRHLGVELRMNARVTGVDGQGVDVETKGGTERIAARTVVWAAGGPGIAARGRARRRHRRAGRPRRADRRAARPHPPRASRGLRGRRHGHLREPPRRRGGRHARRAPRGEHDPAPSPRRRSIGAVPLPRSRERGHDRTVPCGVSVRGSTERVPRVDRLAARPHFVPERVRESLHDPSPLDDVDARTPARPERSSASRTPAAT